MKKRSVRKLHLHRETVRNLVDEDLAGAAGGYPFTTNCTTTDTCTATTCPTGQTDCTRCSTCCP